MTKSVRISSSVFFLVILSPFLYPQIGVGLLQSRFLPSYPSAFIHRYPGVTSGIPADVHGEINVRGGSVDFVATVFSVVWGVPLS
jgi:hypothetical protein